MLILEDGTILPSSDEEPSSNEFWSSVALATDARFAYVARARWELRAALARIHKCGTPGPLYAQESKDMLAIADVALRLWG